MKSKWRLYAAIGLMIFFLIGHTIGSLTRKDLKLENSIQTLHAMETTFVELPGGLSDHSVDEFYQGMSLSLDASILLIIGLLVLCLTDGQLQSRSKSKLLLFVIFWTTSISVLSFLYIFPVPAFTCLICAALLSLEWYMVQFFPKNV
ncbi:hypothetical protein EHQ23_06690 [Leptospira bourretii]|uniref:Vitamin K epoxide reductase domain-containing protein n=1 Tax=Leptospira bourretii TaxID=2484962 RepID=A0A4R9IJ15_9LEPT|nr:hypothetical protein [Leptospira bourretii]TGK88511.1 hypothetical protein EHQ23_06690 [Leptospira bourretii]TGK89157.1 hypothetical protein EHQ26_19215 [Leptospira bourretii]TGL21449.1 hypothetical protein EHQ47_11820 [Leptospira bourretii]TGL32295.1 hypothetical protein EHQ45_11850 [Leptospira bourretii]